MGRSPHRVPSGSKKQSSESHMFSERSDRRVLAPTAYKLVVLPKTKVSGASNRTKLRGHTCRQTNPHKFSTRQRSLGALRGRD